MRANDGYGATDTDGTECHRLYYIINACQGHVSNAEHDRPELLRYNGRYSYESLKIISRIITRLNISKYTEYLRSSLLQFYLLTLVHVCR